jgi:hypothetical protein
MVGIRKIKQGYDVLRTEGPRRFATESYRYGVRQLPEEEELHVRMLKKQAERRIRGNVLSDPLSLIYIDPNDVEYVTPVSEYTDNDKPNPEDVGECIFDIPYATFSRKDRFGSVVDGPWDRKETRFNDVFIFDSFKSRFIDGIPWEETEYVDRVAEFFQVRGEFKGYESLSEFKADRLPFLDELYNRISNGEYRLQEDFGGSIFNELTINIGRDGELYFNSNGAHRLTMSKLADVDRIPALVIVRHKEWVESRERYQRSSDNGSIPTEYMSHPDTEQLR